MPVTDADVGITEFLSSHRPFRAVVKQTVDDFVVNEILLSGNTARITQLARSAAPKQKRKAVPQDVEPIDLDKLPFQKLDSYFPSSTPSSTPPSTLIRDALNSKETSVILPPCSDKQIRTQIHAWVRENLPTFVTDTVETDGQSAVRLRRKDLCRPWKRRRADVPNKSTQSDAAKDETYDPREGMDQSNRSLHVGPNTYVQFFLWKRNRDTTEAISTLGRILNVPANAFAYAGTKDKRAVTTQLVQVRGISEGRFAHANRVLQTREKGFRSMVIGNVTPAPRRVCRPLGLGDLRGNRFTLALRDLELDKDGGIENVMAGVDTLREKGFVNYFGLQRFGSGVSPTHETGFAALRGDFEDVCRRILLPLRIEDEREGMRPDRKRFFSAIERFSKKEISAKELGGDVPRWMFIERTVVGSFVDDEKRGLAKYDFKKAFGSLPRNLKKMYGHAVQSFLWNVMASERIRQCRPNSPERMFAVEADIVPKGEKWIRDFSYETGVRTVTKEEENNKSVSVFRVLIPVIGSEVCLPDAKYSCAAGRILKEQQIDLKSKLLSEFGMKGTYRPLLSKPFEVEARVVAYANRNAKLIQSGVEELCEHNGTEAKDKQDTSLIKEDRKPDTPIENISTYGKQTAVASNNNDTMSENVEEKNLADVKEQTPTFQFVHEEDGSRPLTAEDEQCDPVVMNTQASEEIRQRKTEAHRHALILSFTLGCAEYATMLVRELTHQDSSTANQKAIQDGVSMVSSTSHKDKRK